MKKSILKILLVAALVFASALPMMGCKEEENGRFRPDAILAFASLGSRTYLLDLNNQIWVRDSNNYYNRVKEEVKFSLIVGGFSHILAIDIHGNLWGWGQNDKGQLGLGKSTERISYPIQIMSGTHFSTADTRSDVSFAIDTYGTLWAFGGGGKYGNLGNGTFNENVYIPINISKGNQFSQVNAGDTHNAAIDVYGYLWTWGRATSGELGDPSLIEITPFPETITITLRGIPGKIIEDTKFSRVSVGFQYTLAIDVEGNLWGFGGNFAGQLGRHPNSPRDLRIPINIIENNQFLDVFAGSWESFAIDTNGYLWRWGGQTRIPDGTWSGTLVWQYRPIKVSDEVRFTSFTRRGDGIDIEGNIWRVVPIGDSWYIRR
ncbi:MAG: hypothetical protein FWE22_01430 [Firmicutes bacterium]|nr:hypothetical protein [Bacillota bacterium]